jgi:hypothetical protein
MLGFNTYISPLRKSISEKEIYTHKTQYYDLCRNEFLQETGPGRKAGSKQLVYYEAGDIYQK